MKTYLGLVFSQFFSLFFLFFSPFFSSPTGCPSQMRTKCDIWFLSWPIYSLIFLLIAIKSSSTLILKINLFYFNFGILSSLIMPFMSHLINYGFNPYSNTNSGFHKLSFHIFILNKNSQKYYNGTWCTYAPLQSHVLYTLPGRGVTVQVPDLQRLHM